MSNDETMSAATEGCFVLGTCAILCIIASIMGGMCGAHVIQKQAIERGYMIHDPQTGELEWVEREGKE